MKKTTIAIFSVMVMLVLAACNGGSYKRTKSGLMYKIISDGKNSPKTKKGQVLKFDFVQKLRDSVLFSSAENGHGYVVVDSAVVADYNPNEIFPLLRKGDSAVVIYEADTIKKKSGQLPPFLKPKDKIFLLLKVVDVFNSEEEANKDRDLSQAEFQKKQEAKNEVQKQKELDVLREYAKSKNITVQSAPKGTLVEITNPGTGPSCDSGKFVTVMYTGQTMAGVVFDSSVDPKFQHPGQPYTFQIGSTPPGAIEGWNDGLRLFKKGGKGRLLIPSVLGYGKRGNGNDIKPDENLIFDVEIVNVSDTMAARPAPGGAPNE
jgi:FKBP-type peptidyl-prolyl cis-trans isomerase